MVPADTIRLCVCFLYYKPVTPNYCILELDHDSWLHFIRARTKETRVHLICAHLGRETKACKN